MMMIGRWRKSVEDRLRDMEEVHDLSCDYGEMVVQGLDKRCDRIGWVIGKIWRAIHMLNVRANNVQKTFAEWSPKLKKSDERLDTLQRNCDGTLSLYLDVKAKGGDEIKLNAGDYVYHCYKHEGKWQYYKARKDQKVGFDREMGAWVL